MELARIVIEQDGDRWNTMSRSVFETSIEKVDGFKSRSTTDALAVEEPLEIQLGYGTRSDRKVKSIAVTMRTPGYDFELAAGFLLTEGVIHDVDDIEKIGYSEEGERAEPEEQQDRTILPYQPRRNIVRIELAPDVPVSLAHINRNFYTTSSCGICGKASLLALQSVCPPRIPNHFSISAEVLYSLPARLREAQNIFNSTGGLHGVGLFSAQGKLISIHEDVGRHNAVDKLIGAEFLQDRTPLRDTVLLLSGRASFELLQKALMSGVPMAAAVGAPSSLAVQVARQFDIALVGFLRDNHFNIYHGAEHVSGCSSTSEEEHL
jgi:FdhD protein